MMIRSPMDDDISSFLRNCRDDADEVRWLFPKHAKWEIWRSSELSVNGERHVDGSDLS